MDKTPSGPKCGQTRFEYTPVPFSRSSLAGTAQETNNSLCRGPNQAHQFTCTLSVMTMRVGIITIILGMLMHLGKNAGEVGSNIVTTTRAWEYICTQERHSVPSVHQACLNTMPDLCTALRNRLLCRTDTPSRT